MALSKFWKQKWVEYTQECTFHGVNHTLDPRSVLVRRLIWTLIVLVALGVFLALVIMNVITLSGHPKTVDVEINYNTTMEFPTITLCNQNTFRKTAAQKMGLFDTISKTFGANQRALVNSGDEADDLEGSFETYEDQYLSGLGSTFTKYSQVTDMLCRKLCVDLHSDDCCSIIYIRASTTCYITPYDSSASNVELRDQVGVTTLKRKKCKLQKEAFCDFEDGSMCSFVQDSGQSLSWGLEVAETEHLEAPQKPPIDHTLSRPNGTFLYSTFDYFLPDLAATLMSPYLLAEDDMCIQMYYQVFGGRLALGLGFPGTEVQRLWEVGSLGRRDGSWEQALVRLPQGYYRVYIQAFTISPTDSINIAVDDVYIGPCPKPRDCKTSAMGVGYKGERAVSLAGRPCQPWTNLTFTPGYWQLPSGSMADLGSFCRNPDGDTRGPWCFTNLESARMEYCDVQMCGCGEGQVACNNGNCIPGDYSCDGKDNCGDATDETNCQYPEVSMNCTFSYGSLCGYTISPIFTLFDYTDSLSVHLDSLSEGATVEVRSPEMPLVEGALCLEMALRLQGVHLDVYASQNENLPDMDVFLGSLTPVNDSMRNMTTVFHNVSLDDTGSNDTRWSMELEGNVTMDTAFYLIFRAVVTSSAEDIRRLFDLEHVTFYKEECSTPIQLHVLSLATTLAPTPTTTTVAMNDTQDDTSMAPEVTSHTADRSESATVAVTTPRDVDRGSVTDGVDVTTGVIVQPTLVSETGPDPPADPTADSGQGVTGAGLRRRKRQAQGPLTTAGGGVQPTTQPMMWTDSGNYTEDTNSTGWEDYWNATMDATTVVMTTTAPPPPPLYIWLDAGDAGCMSCHRQVPTSEQYVGRCWGDSLECDFDYGCSCGYSYQSSNVNTDWAVVYETAGNYTDEVAAFIQIGGTAEEDDTTALRTPLVRDTPEHACLQFLYKLRHARIAVSAYNESATTALFSVLDDGQDGVWHKARFDLITGGQVGLIFNVIAQDEMSDSVALDNVTLSEGSCQQDDTGSAVSVNCNFDDIDICGYRDVTYDPFTMEWFRSKTFENTSPGGYYIRTTTSGQGKLSRWVLSPTFSVNDWACVSFYYTMQMLSKLEWATFALYTIPWDDDAPRNFTTGQDLVDGDVVWTVQQITDNAPHMGQAEIPAGSYRLLFEVNGDMVKAALDDVLVTEGICGNITCGRTEAACQNPAGGYQACVSTVRFCDGVPHCRHGLDEMDCQEDAEASPAIDSDFSEVPDGEGDVDFRENQEKAADYSASVEEAIDQPLNDLTEMFMVLGHQVEDFIYKCIWKGVECTFSNFTEIVTDYGLCYSFNPNGEENVGNPGASSGLTLTVNIEQYEYMIGPNPDAGLKLFLHRHTDIPRVRDLGFAVAPGTHTLVGSMLTTAENLPPDYGECGVIDLNFYEDYTMAKCVMECDVYRLANKTECGCRDAYMPERGGQPRLCSIDEYFSCIVPKRFIDRTFSEGTDCSCIIPCRQSLYEGSLSYSSLSIDSVDRILDRDRDNLRLKFDEALNTAQRTDNDVFTRDIRLVQDTLSLYSEVTGFVKRYLGLGLNSTIIKLAEAAGKMATICQQDLSNLFQSVDALKAVYDMAYRGTVNLIQKEMDVLELAAMETRLFARTRVESATLGHSVATRAADAATVAKQALDLILVWISNTTLNVDRLEEETGGIFPLGLKKSELESYLPVGIYSTERCANIHPTVIDLLVSLESLYSQISMTTTGQEFFSVSEKLRAPLLKNITSFLDIKQEFQDCLQHYERTITDMQSWYADVTADIETNMKLTNKIQYNLEVQTAGIRAMQRAAEQALSSYSQAAITKFTYLEAFASDARGPSAIITLESFIERIKSSVTAPLTVSIQDMSVQLNNYYVEGLRRQGDMEVYLTPYYFYNYVTQMDIWRGPIPNIDDPDQYHDKGTELWTIWNRDSGISLSEFVQEQTFIRDSLREYADVVLDEIVSFEQQLNNHENSLTTKLETLASLNENLKQQRAIDATFVQNNYLTLDVFFKELQFQTVTQIRAYDVLSFFSDLGGLLGLLIGGSVLSLAELVDFFLYNGYLRYKMKRSKTNGANLNKDGDGHKTVASVENQAYDPVTEDPNSNHAVA